MRGVMCDVKYTVSEPRSCDTFNTQICINIIFYYFTSFFITEINCHMSSQPILCKNSELHSYNTCIKDEPHFLSVGSNLGQRSTKYQGTHLWCSLPQKLKTISSTRLFKRKLKNYLQNVHHDLN